jgi:glycosyltransferase involved in cell wall biosynthesis
VTASSATRILRIITRLNIGGPSIQAATLSHRLEPHGFATRLVHGRLGEAEGDMSYLLDGTGVEHTYLPSLQRPPAVRADAATLVALYRIMREVRPAIVHTHMAKAGALGRAAAVLYNRTAGRRSPARLVHTYHGHVLEGYFSPPTTAVLIRAERALAHATDCLIAISPQIKKELLAEYHIGRDSQYAVIPLGFDLSSFAGVAAVDRARARGLLDIAPDVPVIVTVGRLTPIKQHHLLLDAARLVADAVPELIVLIAGHGELAGELDAQARRLRLADNVRFLGWRRDLDTIYAAADLFALTSRNEGTPVALIEAMAAGRPGVSTDVGGVRDVIVDDSVGHRVPDGDARQFADAILGLLRDPNRSVTGERARQHVLRRYGIDRLVHDIVELYRTMLKHPTR